MKQASKVHAIMPASHASRVSAGCEQPSLCSAIRLEDWSQMSIAQLQSPVLLFGAEAEVTPLITAHAAPCGTQGACVRGDAQQLSSIGQPQVSTVEGSAAIVVNFVGPLQRRLQMVAKCGIPGIS